MDHDRHDKHRIAVDVRDDPTIWLLPEADDHGDDMHTTRYMRRSANLPHMGDEAEHAVVGAMEQLRRVSRPRLRR